MTTQFTNRTSRFEANGFGGRLNPFSKRGGPTIIVGIQRDTCPPLAFGSHRLQRMQVIVIAPQQAAEFFDTASNDLDQDSLAEVLPLLPPGLGLTRPAQMRPRPILGEILRGENGAFYERFGNRIRPLRRLVSGLNGEVLEIADHGDAPPRLRARVAAPVETEDEKEIEVEPAQYETRPAPTPSPLNGERAGVRGETNGRAARTTPAFHPLFPEPGQWRVVRLGDFKPMLVPQLVHPERLRDVHRLPCYVQVFEVVTPQRIETLAEAIFGDASATSQMRPLTTAIVQHLQLAPLLPAPTRPPRPGARQPGLLLPHDRVFYLEIASDPTLDTQAKESNSASEKSHPSSSSRGNEAPTDKSAIGNPKSEIDHLPEQSAVGNRQSETDRPPSPSTPTAAPGPTTLKTSIPAQLLKPWEFRYSRDEALFEMSRAWSFTGKLRALLRRLAGGLLFSNEFRRWQVMLSGKSVDEQLWTVRPPRGGLSHPFVRQWAQHTLELAGYDPHAMLMEWEIFWIRKNL